MIYSLFVINKAGGLIYQIDFPKDGGHQKLTSNEYLVLAGTFHGVHAIASKLSPTDSPSSGLEIMVTDTFKLHCFQTLTGIKFLLSTDLNTTNVSIILGKIYEIYSDYVMKNPFYTLEMPIRCDLFDIALRNLIT
jgi:hypothetical protein